MRNIIVDHLVGRADKPKLWAHLSICFKGPKPTLCFDSYEFIEEIQKNPKNKKVLT